MERIFLANEALGNDLISLSQADALSSLPQSGEPNLENINRLIEKINQLKLSSQGNGKEGMQPLITGKDLIALGMKPNPRFSKILEELREAQLDGRIKTKEEGLELVKKVSGDD